MQREKINFRDQEPQCERIALCFLPIPLTKGGLLNHFQSQGTGSLGRALSGPPGIKQELAEKGGSKGRAAFWDSFPQFPTCTQPNRRQDYESQNSARPPFPFTPGERSQTLKETPKALSPQA